MNHDHDSEVLATVLVRMDALREIVSERFTRIDTKLDATVNAVARHGERIAVTESKVEDINSRLDSHSTDLKDVALCEDVQELRTQVQALVGVVQELQVKQAVTWMRLTMTGGGGAIVGSLLTMLGKYLTAFTGN